MRHLDDITTTLIMLNTFKNRRSMTSIRAELLAEATRKWSTPISETRLKKERLAKLMEVGVHYVGELHYMRDAWDRNGGVSRQLGMSAGMDPLAAGWRPPYWDDPQFIAALSMPCCVYFGEFGNLQHGHNLTYRTRTFARSLHAQGIRYMGQYLREILSRDITIHLGGGHEQSLSPHKMLEQTEQYRLRRYSLVPQDWRPPDTVPTALREEETLIANEVALYETPRAWVVEWRITDGRYGYSENILPNYRPSTRVIASHVQDTEKPRREYPYKDGVVQVQRAMNPYTNDVTSFNRVMRIDGTAVFMYSHTCDMWWCRHSGNNGSYPGCSWDGANVLNSIDQPRTVWIRSTACTAARAFSDKEHAETFQAEIIAKTGMPIEDED